MTISAATWCPFYCGGIFSAYVITSDVVVQCVGATVKTGQYLWGSYPYVT